MCHQTETPMEVGAQQQGPGDEWLLGPPTWQADPDCLPVHLVFKVPPGWYLQGRGDTKGGSLRDKGNKKDSTSFIRLITLMAKTPELNRSGIP